MEAGGRSELDDTGAFSLANELKTRDTDSNGTANYTLAYDKSGNQTDDGKDYIYVYDGFGRLRQVKNRSDSSLVAEYRYNAPYPQLARTDSLLGDPPDRLKMGGEQATPPLDSR